jgi:hypothetical protein
MNARFELDQYLAHARRRLRWILSARGAAVLMAALLAVTVIAAWMLPRYGFTPQAALAGRVALAAAATGAIIWWALRWRAQEKNRAAAALEAALPSQQGRIVTYLQESAREPGKASVLLDLLAADALALAQREPLSKAIHPRTYAWPVVGAVASLAALAVLLLSNLPLGDGARQLWFGQLPPAARVAAAAGGIAVRPGDATVRRNHDLDVSALVAGSGDDVRLHVRFGALGDWESAPMQRNADGSYSFTIYAVRDAASYYVTAGRLKSVEYRINVVDLPSIERFKVRYDYPTWTGLDDHEEEGGGDLRAVAGTRVTLELTTSAPLEAPLLVIDGNGQELKQRGAVSSGSFAIEKEGHYRIATRFLGEIVPLTPDYAIELVEDQKPEIRIVRPGRDYRATAIEEVPVRVQARDDFRLDALELHYSVNGGEWKREKLPAGSGDIQAAALLRLEEMQKPGADGSPPLLSPGDLVSYYAQARDHEHTVQTDLFLIQVQPFEQRYTQAQAGGGGGGQGGGEEEGGDISRRQREILIATWNLQRNEKEAGAREKERLADNARMLAEVQQTLASQAQTLIQRAQARQLTGQDRAIDEFVRAVQDAAKAMLPAARSLAQLELAAAVTHEQQALQHLLRAEAAFRDINVAMNMNSGGGAGGAQAGRDVSEMTELELDLARNQYETESSMSRQQRAQVEDEVQRRLRELARRQEQLARQQQRQQIPPEQLRWQQERLRREIEEVRRELEQLAQQNAQQQGGRQQASQQGSPQQGSQGSPQQGSQQQASRQGGPAQGPQQQQSASSRMSPSERRRAEAAAEAARQLEEAQRQLQNGDRESQQRALAQLRRAREQLESARQLAGADGFEDLAERARRIAERQRQSEEELRAMAGPRAPSQQPLTFEDLERLAAEKREIQGQLEELQRRIEATRREAGEAAPRAARQLADIRRRLQEEDPVGSLGISARQIERGRVRDAANMEPFRTQRIEELADELENAARVAASEVGRRQQQQEQATTEDLLAELGDVRRLLEQARELSLAQNRSQGDPDAVSPNAQDGQMGQPGGQQGQQGGGNPGQRGQDGGAPGEQAGAQRGADGGIDDGRFGAGSNRWGGYARFSGGGDRDPLPVIRNDLRNQAVISAERLAQIREQLRNSGLTAADSSALRELADRLRRGGVDPMDAEYQRMAALVNQIELSALKAMRAEDASRSTRASEAVDDSRQYRDNVAEYYRRLGGGND